MKKLTLGFLKQGWKGYETPLLHPKKQSLDYKSEEHTVELPRQSKERPGRVIIVSGEKSRMLLRRAIRQHNKTWLNFSQPTYSSTSAARLPEACPSASAQQCPKEGLTSSLWYTCWYANQMVRRGHCCTGLGESKHQQTTP